MSFLSVVGVEESMLAAKRQLLFKSWLTPAVALASILLAAVVGGLVTTSAIASGWYAGLHKPDLNPPNWVFGPVWTTLYILMAIAFVMVWRTSFHDAKDYKAAFGTQIALNFLWSIVFFGLRSPLGGAFVILALLAAIVWTIYTFSYYKKAAGWLLAPYLAWVCFATYLNISIATSN